MKTLTFTVMIIAVALNGKAQIAPNAEIPKVLSNLSYNSSGKLVLKYKNQEYTDLAKVDAYQLPEIIGSLTGTETGILLDINRPGYIGTVAYGPYNETAEYPKVAFLPKDVKLKDGKALLEFKRTFTKATDFFHLADKGKGVIAYRIMDSLGRIIYEGRVAFQGKGPYEVVPTVIQGPLVNDLKPTGCIISYETLTPLKTTISVGGKKFSDENAIKIHELLIEGLQPSTDYKYLLSYGDRIDSHTFKTAPKEGSRKPFTFAFASANRATTGGGERDFGGTNYQSSRTIMAAALLNNAAFMQCTGDFTTGGNTSEGGHMMEYANFKRALEPFWAKIPVYVGFGDHEPNKTILGDAIKKKGYSLEIYPYETVSGEATFAKSFVNPQNGPQSEDGASYDPDPNKQDFPTYKENVYYYTYDNIGMIVLNTEYWESKDPMATGGCPEGYIMDQQVKWLNETMIKMEKDSKIDHIFVNLHGAVFPNGDHLSDAMWWDGDNTSRAAVAGVPLSKGTIERRDEIIDMCVNRSKKFIAFISGDEHNFSFLQITPGTPIYLDNYTGHRIKISRPFYNINNGGGGSAPYAMLKSPWAPKIKYFTEPPTVALISVNGQNVTLKAFNVETFERICTDVVLRK